MKVCIAKINLVRKEGWNYFVDGDGDVSRTRQSSDGDPAIHKVVTLGLKMNSRKWYSIDPMGNVIESDEGN